MIVLHFVHWWPSTLPAPWALSSAVGVWGIGFVIWGSIMNKTMSGWRMDILKVKLQTIYLRSNVAWSSSTSCTRLTVHPCEEVFFKPPHHFLYKQLMKTKPWKWAYFQKKSSPILSWEEWSCSIQDPISEDLRASNGLWMHNLFKQKCHLIR